MKLIRQQFRNAAPPFAQRAAPYVLKASGICGCIAGAFVFYAGASGFTTVNPGLISAAILEWTSFGTTAKWGDNDKDKEGDKIEKSVLSKTVHPWRYPFTSNMVQQGVCGAGYAAGGIWNTVWPWAEFSAMETIGLVAQGLCCIAAPFFENLLPERPGWRHPRTIATGSLAASSLILLATGLATGNRPLTYASLWFLASNGLQAVARRQEINTQLSTAKPA